LFIRQNIPIAVIEAKSEYANPGKGLQRAKVNALPALHLSRCSLLGRSSGQLQSSAGEELRPLFFAEGTLLPFAEGATARSPRSAAEWEGGALKGEL
jgi:type I site-specific restriction endonuclease